MLSQIWDNILLSNLCDISSPPWKMAMSFVAVGGKNQHNEFSHDEKRDYKASLFKMKLNTF